LIYLFIAGFICGIAFLIAGGKYAKRSPSKSIFFCVIGALDVSFALGYFYELYIIS